MKPDKLDVCWWDISVLGSGHTSRIAGITLVPHVLLAPGLLLDVQVAVMARRAYYQLGQVHQLKPFLYKKELGMVI